MIRLRVVASAVLFAVATAIPLSAARADDPLIPRAVPDRAATRQKIDQVIASCKADKSKATLGVIVESVELSISFGAPAWNLNDRKACADFYAKTAQSLVDAFPDGDSATPAAAA